MLLPYASYLRVYEPAEPLSTRGLGAGRGDPPVETAATVTLSSEQRTVLSRTLAETTAPRAGDDLAGCYLMRRDGSLFVCPVDLVLRSWLAMAAFIEDADEGTEAIFLAHDQRAAVDAGYAAWRAANPTALPHIRQATWGVPRTWFLLIAQEEREQYDLEGETSVRFRTPVTDARRRLLSGFTILNATIDDDDLLQELSDLGGWLAAFPDESWVEVDYAGVARLLGPALAGDRSAYEVKSALRAIQRRDFATAGETYRQFVERWRTVTAMERAN
ncbi:MAG: hypothetical protein WKF54_08555 [Nocardioidaceae bacterium]